MASPKQTSEKTTQIQKDVRNVMFFIFFALTVGAATGLLGNLHSAFDTDGMSAESQLSAAVITSDMIPGIDVIPQVVGEGDKKRLTLFLDDTSERLLVYSPADETYFLFFPGVKFMGLKEDSPMVVNAKEEIGKNFSASLPVMPGIIDTIRGVKSTTQDSYWSVGDGMIPGVYKKPSSHAGSQSQVWFGEGDQLVYFSDSDKYFVFNGRTGKYIPAEGKYLEGIKDTINNEYFRGESPQAPENSRAVIESSAGNSQVVIEPTTKDNRCSTTYVSREFGSGVKEINCYGKGEDKARKAVDTLAKCVALNTSKTKKPDDIAALYKEAFPALETGMCKGPKAQEVKKVSGNVAVLSQNPTFIYKLNVANIPKACEKQYKDVVGMMGGLNGTAAERKTATSATDSDASTCAWKGAAVCYEAGPGSGDFTCKSKADLATGEESTGATTPPATTNTPPVATGAGDTQTQPECKGLMCFFTDLLKDKKFQKSIGNMLTGLLAGNKGPCPKGFVQVGATTEGDKTTARCEREPESAQPQCVIAAQKTTLASGESTLLRWKTANARNTTITGVGIVDANGETTLSPKETTTYTLTATNGNNTKTCETTVMVDGQLEGPTGEHPPTLSCAPKKIQPEEQVSISWKCPAPADDSAGVGIATRGALSGTVDVTPSASTDYTVKCFTGDEEIGRNVCSVTVGNPQSDIIAYPAVAGYGERTRISWATLFMESCKVTGPRGFEYAHTQGVVVTEPFDKTGAGTPPNAVYTLSCRSDFGTDITKEVVVGFEE